MGKSPVREYKIISKDSGDPGYVNKMLIGTATRGTIRMEWAIARWGQIIPTNWSAAMITQFIQSFIPIRYTVPDAQNIIVKEMIEKDFEWLLLLEDDTIPPPDCFIKLNQYMRKAEIPIVSGLYYTKSFPAEPLLYRGRGTSYYDRWKMGDKVWVDGVPTGCLLIHRSILKALWDESPEYMAGDVKTRRIFETPERIWQNPQTGEMNTVTGTSDLEFCSRVIRDGILKKAGWPDIAKKKYPFLVDTSIFCRHIDPQGVQYPTEF